MPELDLHKYMGVENSDFLIPKDQEEMSLWSFKEGKKDCVPHNWKGESS